MAELYKKETNENENGKSMSDMKIIYLSDVYEDGDTPSIELHNVCDLDEEKLLTLLSDVINALVGYRNAKKRTIEVIQGKLPLLTAGEIKAIGEFKLKDKSLYFQHDSYGRLEGLPANEPIPTYQLERISEKTGFFVLVEPPKAVQKQIDAHLKEKAAKNKEEAAKKKERMIRKAQRLLEKEGMK